jgi:hypothetical protein
LGGKSLILAYYVNEDALKIGSMERWVTAELGKG